MTQRKGSTETKKAAANSRQRKSENGTRPAGASKLSRNGSIQATDERMLRLWKKIYEDHHPAEKGQSR